MTYLDSDRRIQKLSTGSVAIPITNDAAKTLSDNNFSLRADSGEIRYISLPKSKKVTRITLCVKLLSSLRKLLKCKQIAWTGEIEKDVAKTWERRGDLVLLPQDSFQLPLWKGIGKEASITAVCRLCTVPEKKIYMTRKLYLSGSYYITIGLN